MTFAELERCDRAITAIELASLLHMHRLTIYRMAHAGRIPGSFHIGTALRFDPRKIVAWIKGSQ